MSRPTHTSQLPSLADAQWLKDPRTRMVLDALESHGFEARIVGGAVRNALLAHPVQDIDIATPARPDAVIDAAHAAGLKAIPTGIDHGTVTIIAESTPFEITTLRRDEETDGRHALVAFTDDWIEDAKRRDFTINAMYCDKDGVVFDPVGGLEDIKQQRVRFIGDAESRIKEDYLRILRFFRFTASFGTGQCDALGLASCANLRAGLDQLAGERIANELKKLLIARHAGNVIAAMKEAGVLARLFQPRPDVARLKRAITIDGAVERPGEPVQRLAALCVHNVKDAVWLRDRLRLSSRDFNRLALMTQPTPRPTPDNDDERDAKTYLYTHGPEAYRDAHLLAWAGSDVEVNNKAWRQRLALAERWPIPTFPITGGNVLALGVQPGPNVGRILSEVEAWWIRADFPDDLNLLNQRLAEVAKVTKS